MAPDKGAINQPRESSFMPVRDSSESQIAVAPGVHFNPSWKNGADTGTLEYTADPAAINYLGTVPTLQPDAAQRDPMEPSGR